ncbi:MAG: RtcB family protein [Candidatus Paceibacterota bacterium]
MISKDNILKIHNYLWEIPKSFRKEMKVPARVYVSEKMLDEVLKDRSLIQLVNLCCLQGIVRYGLAMPDCHEGYASPIGGVAAVDIKEGIISPGMCGYDINCGMKLLLSELDLTQIQPFLEKLAQEIYEKVPSGLGKGHRKKLEINYLNEILEKGAIKLLEDGFLEKEDIVFCESQGRLNWAQKETVSNLAKERGRDQLGTLGSGNHFLEIQKVEEIYDEKVAQTFGLFKDQITIMIHTGSRGLGHQVASDYIRQFLGLMRKYNISIPDREFACVPFNSLDGQRYFSAMACAANFAWANRGMIAYYVRKAWKKIIGDSFLKTLYDVAHNIIKKEKYKIEEKEMELIVHRKGATRSFPPLSLEIPEKYQSVGQPVLIPGSMGTSSYVLVGTSQAEESFFSTCHGAGRTMSRHFAIKSLSANEIINYLKQRGIIFKCASLKGLQEEAPQAYKNIDEVVEVVHQANLSKKVAKLIPLAVIKGE